MSASDLLLSQQTLLTRLAEGWLADSAESFSVWSAGRRLMIWPSGFVPSSPALVAPILAGNQALGELRLTGLNNALARGRLRSEAQLLARILQIEGDLEQMTAELMETQDQLLAMYDLTQATRSHLGIVETLRRLASESARLLRTQGAVLFLTPTLVQYPSGMVDERRLLGYLQQVRETGQELMLTATAAERPADLDNLYILPIRIRGHSIATLGLINRIEGFGAPDIKLARAVAEQAGAQIENILLYQETLEQTRLQAEMEIARKVQLQLLPQKRPALGNLDVFAETRPAFQVGGDFYDFVAVPGRPLMLLLGDVSGKGVPAALIMGMIRAVIRSAARFMPDPTPATVLSRTNNDLYDDLTMLEAFVTTFVAQYNPASRTIHYANAGHAPVIYRPANGNAHLIPADSVPVGVLPISQSENHSLDFGPDALLVVTTDGFNESRSPSGELFGYDRLLHLIDEFASQPAQVIATALFSSVEIFAAGRPQDDDQTLIVIKGAAL